MLPNNTYSIDALLYTFERIMSTTIHIIDYVNHNINPQYMVMQERRKNGQKIWRKFSCAIEVMINYTFSRACVISAIMSSTFSSPTESLISPGATPAALSCSSES